MKSFRLIFTDIDNSITLSTLDTPVKGYIGVRAPKGEKEAYYFAPGNTEAIKAMIGVPDANWSDIYHAIAFNDYYGLYVSAPAGSSDEYPSYYGGVYLTNKGPRNYWHVDDKANPSYEIKVDLGNESIDYDDDVLDTDLDLSDVTIEENGLWGIKISNISPAIKARLNYFTLVGWKDQSQKISEGDEITFHVVGNKVYVNIDDEDITVDSTNTAVNAGSFELENGTYTLTLKAGLRDGELEGYPRFTLGNMIKGTEGTVYEWVKSAIEGGKEVTINDIVEVGAGPDGLTGAELLKDIILNGRSSTFSLAFADDEASEVPFASVKSLWNRLYWRLNIRQDTFMRISQKSPSEKPTLITLSNIGYDKYKYDYNVQYVSKTYFESVKDDAKSAEGFLDAIALSNSDMIIDVVDVSGYWSAADIANSGLTEAEKKAIKADNTKFVEGDINKNLHSLYQYNSTTNSFTDITPKNRTKKFYIPSALKVPSTMKNGQLVYANAGKTFGGIETQVESNLDYTIWEIAATSNKDSFKHTTFVEEETGTHTLKKDLSYNTVTLSYKEEVEPGEYVSYSDVTGSLSETGKDANGGNIYWPNVLPDDQLTFIEVEPVNTFDDIGLNDYGFWAEEKIVDPIGPAIDVYSFSIKGQRYCTKVNKMNQEDGLLGSAWRDEYESIVADALEEVKLDDYDDALVIMEVTGQPVFKEKIAALRATFRDTSTFISPRILTKAEYLEPETIVVEGRSKACAQYVQEFERYDSYTGKTYTLCPIGWVGIELARIMDKRLGNAQPAGTRDMNGLGGILSISGVRKAKWKFSSDQLKVLDEKGLVAITYDARFGAMCQSGKSTADPDNVTDWSYLGHSMGFDICKREIRENVMVPQLHKPINSFYMDLRQRQVEAILEKRTSGSNAAWAEASCDIAGVNTATTKAQRKFVIRVKVKVNVYSDYVLLEFENMPQT